MKYLLLILFILLVIFLTKALRGSAGRQQARRSDGAGRADEAGKPMMLACAWCGLHLPRDEALPGKGGVFCSAEHRTRFEAREDAGG